MPLLDFFSSAIIIGYIFLKEHYYSTKIRTVINNFLVERSGGPRQKSYGAAVNSTIK